MMSSVSFCRDRDNGNNNSIIFNVMTLFTLMMMMMIQMTADAFTVSTQVPTRAAHDSSDAVLATWPATTKTITASSSSICRRRRRRPFRLILPVQQQQQRRNLLVHSLYLQSKFDEYQDDEVSSSTITTDEEIAVSVPLSYQHVYHQEDFNEEQQDSQQYDDIFFDRSSSTTDITRRIQDMMDDNMDDDDDEAGNEDHDHHNVVSLWSSTSPQLLTNNKNTNAYNGTNTNPLMDKIEPSKIDEILSMVQTMRDEEGIDNITSLCVGEPDFPPSKAVLDAIIDAAKSGDTKYTAVTGTSSLRNAISADIQRRKNIYYDPNTQIVVSNGAKQAVYQTILATVGVGEKVIIPSPYWPSYPEMVKLAYGIPVVIQTTAETNYLLTSKQLRNCLEREQEEDGIEGGNGGVKMLILCNPSNPTGSVYSRKQLQELADVLQDYPNIIVLADEIYERLIYEDDIDETNDNDNDTEDDTTIDLVTRGSTSMSSISEDMYSRTVVINGFSKSYAMTGLRLGYSCCGSEQISKAITTIQSQFTSCPSSISQAAGVIALTNVSDHELIQNANIMKSKRDYVLQRLKLMSSSSKEHTIKLPIKPPSGAFYILPDVSYYCDTITTTTTTNNNNNNDDTIPDDIQFCIDLLQEQRLALVPGTSFGNPGTIRISYATSMEELQIAMDKLNIFLQSREEEKNKKKK